jgi:outer membrane protein TolC
MSAERQKDKGDFGFRIADFGLSGGAGGAILKHTGTRALRHCLKIVASLALAAILAAGCTQEAGRPPGQTVARRTEDAYARLEQRYNHHAAPAIRYDLPELTEDSDVSDYLEYAALNNPDLEAAFTRWKESLSQVGQARALPGLTVNYQYAVQEMVAANRPKRRMAGMSQTFPWYGKLEGRVGAAAEAAGAARQRYHEERLKLFYRVKSAYSEYAYLAAATRLVRGSEEGLKRLERAAGREPAAAQDPQAVVRVQAELKARKDRLRTLEDMRRPVTERLNAALGRSGASPLPPPRPVAPRPLAASDEQVLAAVRDASPELGALRAEIARAERTVSLARQNYYPDLSFGLYMINTRNIRLPRTPDSQSDDQLWMLALHVPVWFERYEAGVREARRRHWDALKATIVRENELQTEVKVALFRLRDAQRKSDLYRTTLIPKAKEDLARADAALAARAAGLPALLDAQAVLLELELGEARAASDCEIHAAELEMLAGLDLPRGEAAADADRPGTNPAAAGPIGPAAAMPPQTGQAADQRSR